MSSAQARSVVLGRTPVVPAVLALLLVLVSSGFAVGVAGHAGPMPRDTPTSPVAPAMREPPGTPASAVGEGAQDPAGPYVLDTLVLYNNTLVPGNFLAQSGLPYPGAMAYDPSKRQVFLQFLQPETGQTELAVLSETTNTLVATVPLGGAANGTDSGLAYDRAKGELFVSSAYNFVAVVNDTTDSRVATIPVSEPSGEAYDPQTGEVFVTTYPTNAVSVLNDTSNTVVATIDAGGGNGTGIAYDPAQGEVFVAGSLGVVQVIAGATDAVVASVAVGELPWAIAYDAGKGELFVANRGSDNVSVISDTTDRVVGTVAVGSLPDALAYDPSTGEVFVANSGSNSVSVINDTSDTVSAVVLVGSEPDGIADASASGEVFVADSLSSNVSVISGSTDKVVASIAQPYGPIGLAYDPRTAQTFVTDYFGSSVEAIADATDTVVATIPVGTMPRGLAYDPALGELFVANWRSSNVSVISDELDTVVATVALPPSSYPVDVAYAAGSGEVYVTDEYGNNTAVISPATNTVVGSVPVGAYPVGLAYDGATGELFVANSGTDNVSVISDATQTVVSTIPVGSVPYGVAYASGENELFVANSASENVSVISDATDTVVASVPVGWNPLGLAYDVATAEVFVTESQSGNVSVILDATDTVVASVTVGTAPNGVTFDPATGQLLVANWGQGTISFLANGFANTATFTETGLPTGTPWSVDLNGTVLGSRSQAVSFLEANGSYGYAVGTPRTGEFEYVPSPADGNVTMEGVNASVAITFSAAEVYNLSFVESGLPRNTSWSLVLNGATFHENGSTLNVSRPNGTYEFSVAPVAGYAASPANGTVEVQGGNPSPVAITFSLASAGYPLTFSETGLPRGPLLKHGWTVALTGADGTTTLKGNATPTIAFTEPSGVYSVLIVAPKGYVANWSGVVTVAGPTTVPLTMVKGKAMSLSFHEAGLTKGTVWCVQVNGLGLCTTTCLEIEGYDTCGTPASIAYPFLVPRTSYRYAVLSPLAGQNLTRKVGGTTTYGPGGTLLLSKSATVDLRFEYRYAVTFQESGLSSGNWSVTVKGLTLSAAAGEPIVFHLSNGTYGYRVHQEAGYASKGAPGRVIVSGGAAPVAVTFTLKR